MEQIKIIFFVLASFFGIEDGRIAANKTTISIDPTNKQIDITQEELFTLIQSETDRATVLAEWDRLFIGEEREMSWAKELDSFPGKTVNFASRKSTVQPHVTLKYLKEKDLRTLGVWYDIETNEFSVNHIPQYNIKTQEGNLDGNYWKFSGDEEFSFTIEPFLQMPENYQKSIITLDELLKKE